MSFNLYSLDSGIDSDDATEFSKKAILFDRNDVNKLVIAGTEKLNHFSAKAIMFFVLTKLGHNVISECQIIGVGRIDLFDLTTKTIYEFESSRSPKYRKEANEKYLQAGIEVIVIDLNKLPDDIFQRYLKLKEYVVVD